MKNLKTSFLLIAAVFCLKIFAQTQDNPWIIGIGGHIFNHKAAQYMDRAFKTSDWSVVPPVTFLTFSRSITRSFAVDLQVGAGQIDNKRVFINDELVVVAGLGMRYKLTNGYLLKENSWFDPYLRVGVNYHKFAYDGFNISPLTPLVDANGYTMNDDFIGQDNNFMWNFGGGINFWFNRNFGLNAQITYFDNLASTENYINFYHYSASLVFRFGYVEKDRDGDGILDKEDECPDTPGLAEFKGCPDSDGDGIQDKEDACPDVYGLVEFQGCPDTDGDGIQDSEDACPTQAGPKENKGCPWPDRDGDGVLDKDDACPDQPCPRGQAGCLNNGCPEPKKTQEEVAQEVTKTFENLLFEFNKAVVRKESQYKLDDAAAIIKKEGGYYFIDGHTDNIGGAAFNMRLSQARANHVAAELEKRGVPAETLISRGFGLTQPVADNSTEEGRLKNRRVVVQPASEADIQKYKESKATKSPAKSQKSAKKKK